MERHFSDFSTKKYFFLCSQVFVTVSVSFTNVTFIVLTMSTYTFGVFNCGVVLQLFHCLVDTLVKFLKTSAIVDSVRPGSKNESEL